MGNHVLKNVPKPYRAAVSIQLMPRLSAAWIVGTESLSFCSPMFPFGMIQISLFRCRSKDVSVKPKPVNLTP